jgi:hypothetical protein
MKSLRFWKPHWSLTSVYKIVKVKVVKDKIDGQAEKLKEIGELFQALDDLF